MDSPKEKALELVNQFLEKIPFADKNVYKDCEKEMYYKAKQCALICINEMIRICYDHTMASYYGEVKNEIEKL